jgi:NAD(P)-dependent dehydrogenase (short-subunit alcohol dehydrogenase family)
MDGSTESSILKNTVAGPVTPAWCPSVLLAPYSGAGKSPSRLRQDAIKARHSTSNLEDIINSMDSKVHTPPVGGGFGKVVIVTGGSKGIGSGCAKVFAGAGANVAICDLDAVNGERLAAELTAQGPGKCHFERCDVRNTAELERFIHGTVERFGHLDCLINNAGVHPRFKPIDEFSLTEFRDLLEMNLISYFAACKFALPYLRRTKGSVINMGSLTSKLGDHWAGAYSSTKGGVSGLTKALAIEEAKNSVRVNAVLPGNIMTQSRMDLEASMKNGQVFHDYVESWQWVGRSGTIEEVGYACLFLASDHARFITGIELILGGGCELGFGPKAPMPKL